MGGKTKYLPRGAEKRFAQVVLPKKTAGKLKFKHTVTASRQKYHFTEGKGNTGLFVRVPRVRRLLRGLGKKVLKEHADITGATLDPNQKIRFSTSYVQINTAALDATIDQIMKFAYAHAEARQKDKTKGLKLKLKDLQFAEKWYFQFCRRKE